MLTAYVAIAPWMWPGYDHLGDAALSALYATDYSYTFWHRPFYLQHGWSLAVEEHFYLIWPLVLPVMIHRRCAVPALIGLYLACLFWRTSFFGPWVNYYYRFDTHATGLLAGALLYFCLRRLPLTATSAYIAAAILALLMASVPITAAAAVIPFAEVAAVVLIGCVVLGRAGVLSIPLRSPLAVWLGKRSYAIYLWHFPIAVAVRDRLPAGWSILFTLVGAVTAAAVSYVTVEAVGRHLKSVVTERRNRSRSADASKMVLQASSR